MNQYFVFTIGFIAQGLFSARLLIQWISSEKAGKVRSPVIFWQLSVFASFLLIIYGILRKDPVIIFGQTISYYIYLRNLYFQGYWDGMNPFFRGISITAPFLAISTTFFGGQYGIGNILQPQAVFP